jgi:hypothetical protein
MKVTNWCRHLRVSLLAAGVLAPGVVYAQSIPLGDPSFEFYTVPAPPGYAYAAPPNGSYRPTSAWADDLDSPAGYTQDDSSSNWLYNAAYAENTAVTRRPAPRTGVQAMHGLFNYSAQETSAVFEASKAYTFSIWAQNDVSLNESNGVFLYLFDGTVPFSDGNALKKQLFTAINQRGAAMTAPQSQANWTQIDIEHVVLPGAPEIGHPVGVGFFARKDSAVDDAALNAVAINPDDYAVFLEVNILDGQVAIKNRTGEPVNIDYYEITSTTGSLNSNTWTSLQEQTISGFPPGDGSGNGWEQFGASTSNVIGESWWTGNSSVDDDATIPLGPAFRVGFQQNLVFKYGQLGDAVSPPGDFTGDMVVDAADYVMWRKSTGTQEAYDDWRENFGAVAAPAGPSTLVRGFVKYVTSGPGGGSGAVPEPSCLLLVGIGLFSLIDGGRRRLTTSELN